MKMIQQIYHIFYNCASSIIKISSAIISFHPWRVLLRPEKLSVLQVKPLGINVIYTSNPSNPSNPSLPSALFEMESQGGTKEGNRV